MSVDKHILALEEIEVANVNKYADFAMENIESQGNHQEIAKILNLKNIASLRGAIEGHLDRFYELNEIQEEELLKGGGRCLDCLRCRDKTINLGTINHPRMGKSPELRVSYGLLEDIKSISHMQRMYGCEVVGGIMLNVGSKEKIAIIDQAILVKGEEMLPLKSMYYDYYFKDSHGVEVDDDEHKYAKYVYENFEERMDSNFFTNKEALANIITDEFRRMYRGYGQGRDDINGPVAEILDRIKNNKISVISSPRGAQMKKVTSLDTSKISGRFHAHPTSGEISPTDSRSGFQFMVDFEEGEEKDKKHEEEVMMEVIYGKSEGDLNVYAQTEDKIDRFVYQDGRVFRSSGINKKILDLCIDPERIR